jgi:hypothetical protein
MTDEFSSYGSDTATALETPTYGTEAEAQNLSVPYPEEEHAW